MSEPEPILRTLAPLLRNLDRGVRAWLAAPRLHTLTAIQTAETEGLADDLTRQGAALEQESPLLVIMLMGGTGVGKSTLFNALAGKVVAPAAITRPTTRDPVVYYHQSLNPEKLDPALKLCRLVQHDRAELSQKVIVDTPDLDSNDVGNRERLKAVLPVADIVLYVGSQEKYHDQLGWELFKDQRQRRAFAFVLNKWDRCIQTGPTGIRPDEDLIADLKKEGFASPKLFRTSSQMWLDANGATPPELPTGEQMVELKAWLEAGLTRREIEAVKTRGVSALLVHLSNTLGAATPPDYSTPAGRTQATWQKLLEQEADAQAEILTNGLEPFSTDIEYHLSVRGQQRFSGLMAGYLRLVTKLRYVGNGLRGRLPLPGSSTASPVAADAASLDFAHIAYDSLRTTAERSLDPRTPALANKLLVEADTTGLPLALVSPATQAATQVNWNEKRTRAVIDSLAGVEREIVKPTGGKLLLRRGLTLTANILPAIVLLSSIILIIWRTVMMELVPSLAVMLLPLYLTLGTLIILHLLIIVLLPIHWAGVKEDFKAKLTTLWTGELKAMFLNIPQDTAKVVANEKAATEKLAKEVLDVSDWLNQKEIAANIAELYGSSK